MVTDHDGQPAKHIALVAEPVGVGLGAMLPHTRTDDEGKYRFEDVPWWGTYTLYAQDEDAGYSDISTSPAEDSAPPRVEISLDI